MRGALATGGRLAGEHDIEGGDRRCISDISAFREVTLEP